MNTVREPLNKTWSSRQSTEEVNYFVANLGNIPDIPCVLRLVVDLLRGLNADHGLIQRLLKSGEFAAGRALWRGAGVIFFAFTVVLAAPLTNASDAIAAPWSLQQLMAALSQVQSVQTTFTETKIMNMLSEPLHSTGTLVYKAPDYLEKRVQSPQPSYYIVDGDQVTMGSAQHHERQVVLFQFPALQALIAALRGTLAGDIKTLKEYYDVDFSGDAQLWSLQLAPKNEEMQLYVKKILIQGRGDEITRIDTVERNGDSNSMTIHHPSD